jgi:hypothetical protein
MQKRTPVCGFENCFGTCFVPSSPVQFVTIQKVAQNFTGAAFVTCQNKTEVIGTLY